MFLARLNQTHFYAREHQLIIIMIILAKKTNKHEIVEEQIVNCNAISSL